MDGDGEADRRGRGRERRKEREEGENRKGEIGRWGAREGEGGGREGRWDIEGMR